MPTPRIFIFLFLATGRRIQPHRRPPLPTPLRIRRTTLSRGFPLPSRNAVPLPTLPEILPLFRTQPIHVCHLRALMYIHLCTSPNRTYTHSHSHFPLMLVRNSAIYTSCIYIYTGKKEGTGNTIASSYNGSRYRSRSRYSRWLDPGYDGNEANLGFLSI